MTSLVSLQTNLPPTNHHFSNFLHNPNLNSNIFVISISGRRCYKVINSFSRLKSTGPNSIPVIILKITPTLVENLEKISHSFLFLKMDLLIYSFNFRIQIAQNIKYNPYKNIATTKRYAIVDTDMTLLCYQQKMFFQKKFF